MTSHYRNMQLAPHSIADFGICAVPRVRTEELR